MCLIEIKDLYKKFGTMVAVDFLNLNISEGEIFGLLGPNGAGKSTTILMITSLLRPDSGSIIVGGKDISKYPVDVKRTIGYVPQEIALYPTLTAKENLVFWGQLYGLRGKMLKEKIEGVLEVVGLKDRGNGRVNSFSGGMKRRINIAAALLHNPKILIMDEPTVGVDPQSRNYILETILKLNKSDGMTVIYTSHYMEEVEMLCSRIGIIDHGKLIALGTKDELKKLVGSRDSITIRFGTKPSEEVIENIKGLSGIETIEFNTEQSNLENVFLNLTGRELRD